MLDLNELYASMESMSETEKSKVIDSMPRLQYLRVGGVSQQMLKASISCNNFISLALTRIWFEQRKIEYWSGHMKVYCYNDDLMAFKLYGPKWEYWYDESPYNNVRHHVESEIL